MIGKSRRGGGKGEKDEGAKVFLSERCTLSHCRGNLRRKEMALNYIVCL